jgi:peptidoglycan/xylan/chitin deacetylase (PgdA/CDA1 family)
MSAPTVSVITISLDDLDGLKRTVESVRAQRYAGRIEHIVVDGGSGDDVVDYLSGCEPGFAHWQSEPDGGRYDAMNQGIARASGDLLWFMHSKDCFYDPDVVAHVVEAISANADVRDLWGYGLQNIVDPDGRSIGVPWAPVPFNIHKFLTRGVVVPHQASFFGASLVNKLGGYDVDFGIAADQLFILQAALLRDPITLRRVVSNFDCTGGGSIRPLGDHFRDVRRMCDVQGHYPLRGRRTSLAYMRGLELMIRAKAAAFPHHIPTPDAATDAAPPTQTTPQIAEPRGPQERFQRLTQRATDALLATRLGSIRSVRTDEPIVALTFDDGPDPEWTPQILDILASKQSHATFFMLLENARAMPELVRRVVDEGHEVGLHGVDHRSLIGGSRQSTRCLLEGAASELAAIAGTPVSYFRPPYNAQTVATFLGARDAGLDTVYCDLDSLDWSGLEEEQAAAGVVVRAAPGNIVLLHDRLADDPECAFDRAKTMQFLIDGLQRRSLRSTTLTHLIASGKVSRTALFSPRTELRRQVST